MVGCFSCSFWNADILNEFLDMAGRRGCEPRYGKANQEVEPHSYRANSLRGDPPPPVLGCVQFGMDKLEVANVADGENQSS